MSQAQSVIPRECRDLAALNRCREQAGIEQGKGNPLTNSKILSLPGWLQTDQLQLSYPLR